MWLLCESSFKALYPRLLLMSLGYMHAKSTTPCSKFLFRQFCVVFREFFTEFRELPGTMITQQVWNRSLRSDKPMNADWRGRGESVMAHRMILQLSPGCTVHTGLSRAQAGLTQTCASAAKTWAFRFLEGNPFRKNRRICPPYTRARARRPWGLCRFPSARRQGTGDPAHLSRWTAFRGWRSAFFWASRRRCYSRPGIPS